MEICAFMRLEHGPKKISSALISLLLKVNQPKRRDFPCTEDFNTEPLGKQLVVSGSGLLRMLISEVIPA